MTDENFVLTELRPYVFNMISTSGAIPGRSGGRVDSENSGYYYWKEPLPYRDLNRLIVDPYVISGYPEGMVVYRLDSSIWIVAKLPYKFKDVSIEDTAKVLWPGIKDFRIDQTIFRMR